MKTLLPKHGIDVFELPRKQNDDTIISATFVRRLFLENQLEALKNFVPASTYEYLVSEAGQNFELLSCHKRRAYKMSDLLNKNWSTGVPITMLKFSMQENTVHGFNRNCFQTILLNQTVP